MTKSAEVLDVKDARIAELEGALKEIEDMAYPKDYQAATRSLSLIELICQRVRR